MDLVRSIFLASLLTALALLSGCAPEEAREARRSRERAAQGEADIPSTFRTPVLAERIARGRLASTVGTTGSVVPYRSLLIRAEESGRLLFEKQWREGDFVEAGTLIARIDAETLIGDINRSKAEVEIQRENLTIGRRSMESAIREYEIVQDLYARGIAPLRDVETQQLSMERAINTHRQNQINLEKSKAELAVLEARLERTEIRAPFDGLLVARATLEGTKPFTTSFGSETITDFDRRLISNEFAVCGIIDKSKVLLRLDVTSRDIDRIRLAQEAFGLVYGTEDIPVTGTVENISRAVASDTRAFTVDILVDNSADLLRPGMFGRIDVVVDQRLDAISIDKKLVTRRNNRPVVFVVEEDSEQGLSLAREIPIETGLESRDRVEVTSGLKDGDVIITRGFELLQDRTPVTVIVPDEDAVVRTEDESSPLVEQSEETPATPAE